MIFINEIELDRVCPICGKESKGIDDRKEISEKNEVVHENSFYSHYKGHVDYLRREKNPKTIWSSPP